MPLQLTNISSEKQTLIRETGGYPVQWTYYMQGADLYVETKSDDPHFGGVNQTHIGTGKDRILGKIVTVNFRGEGKTTALMCIRTSKEQKLLYTCSSIPPTSRTKRRGCNCSLKRQSKPEKGRTPFFLGDTGKIGLKYLLCLHCDDLTNTLPRYAGITCPR